VFHMIGYLWERKDWDLMRMWSCFDREEFSFLVFIPSWGMTRGFMIIGYRKSYAPLPLSLHLEIGIRNI